VDKVAGRAARLIRVLQTPKLPRMAKNLDLLERYFRICSPARAPGVPCFLRNKR